VNIETVSGPIKFDKETKCAIQDVGISELQKSGNNYVFSKPIYSYKDVPPQGY